MGKTLFKVISFFLILLSVVGEARVFAKLSPAKASKTLVECPAKRLRLKDCHLASGVIKIQVWDKKIFYRNQASQKIIPLAVTDALDLDFVRLKKIANKIYLEVGLWTSPKGDGDVSSLIWSLYLINPNDLIFRGGGTINKRRQNETSKKYSYDKKIEYGVFVKGHSIEWFVGKDKGVLSEI